MIESSVRSSREVGEVLEMLAANDFVRDSTSPMVESTSEVGIQGSSDANHQPFAAGCGNSEKRSRHQ
eukprot:SAG31_NODE_1567_length_7859_cov_18.238531_3_plen_67_part_00